MSPRLLGPAAVALVAVAAGLVAVQLSSPPVPAAKAPARDGVRDLLRLLLPAAPIEQRRLAKDDSTWGLDHALLRGDLFGRHAVDDYFRFWAANPSIGRPVINIGPASSARTYSAVLRECRSVRSGRYIGIYSKTPVSRKGGKLTQVRAALNACTSR
jgi:hypothetical protein